MVRKVRPQDVKDDFATFVDERIAHFDRVESLLLGTQREKRDISLLSETTLHAIYVSFECFLSDLFLAYITRDFSQYQSTISTRMSASLQTKFGSWATGRMMFSPIKHIKLDELESMLDPDSYNLTFKNVAVLKQRATEFIAAPLRNGIVNLSDPDCRLVDTVHAIRNFIAHQSPNAKTLMNAALATVAAGPNCPNILLSRGVHSINDIGAYLKSVGDGQRRVKRIAGRLKEISALL